MLRVGYNLQESSHPVSVLLLYELSLLLCVCVFIFKSSSVQCNVIVVITTVLLMSVCSYLPLEKYIIIRACVCVCVQA